MEFELSKKDRKIAAILIETGLQREFAKSLFEADNILLSWKEKEKDDKEAYYALFKHIKNIDKHIAKRYDDRRTSDYLFIVAALLNEKIITEDEIKDFSEDALARIKIIISINNE